MSNDKKRTRVVSVSRDIPVPPAQIFDLLADPSKHGLIDGEDTVTGSRSGNPERLSKGATFSMVMKFVVPYRISNKVVEFEEDRLIAWSHFGGHVWRYELEAIGADSTRVTESFDWGVARFPPFYEWANYPSRHEKGMAETLERLERVVTE